MRETPEIYQKFVKPLFIDKLDSSLVQWVYNILDRTREIELTVFRNELFTLQLDFEFNHDDLSTLYLLALPIDRSLKSIRDLGPQHLDMLRSMRDDGYKAIYDRFGLDNRYVKAFFHYYPTFYHLHVHFVNI